VDKHILKKINSIEKILPKLKKAYENCDLCLRRCGVNRLRGEKGLCASSARPKVYSFLSHHGEEPPLSGDKGSGVIFFSNCSMNCVYCQNYKFSQEGTGREVSSGELSDIMIQLQDNGCHNINLVSPTHFIPSVVEALEYAYSKGLNIPVIYNTGGYDSLWAIKALKTIVDIYLFDMRYSSDKMAEKYSNAPGYVKNNRALAIEMYRQTGDLKILDGIASKGLIIRLLALPGGISGTVETLKFIAKNIGEKVSLSLMGQYYPAYKAGQHEELARRISEEEYSLLESRIQELGMKTGWVQPLEGGFDEGLAGENFIQRF
jgi:putative pyruvate formate lyase activating enzyme